MPRFALTSTTPGGASSDATGPARAAASLPVRMCEYPRLFRASRLWDAVDRDEA